MGLLRAIHGVVNSTRPDLGPSCWLCIDAQPPYYVGVAVNGSVSHSSDSENCRWEQPRLTLSDVQGKGTCLTSSSSSLETSPYSPICNSTVVVPESSSSFYSAPSGTWWACLDGITQCISAAVFLKESEPLCILVSIIPQVSLLQGPEGWEYFAHDGSVSYRSKRAVPLLIPILVGLGLVGSTAVGTAALVQGEASYRELSAQVDVDLSHLEHSISQLERQVNSLAEMVLQNRRGLDLLFLRQSGFCAALGEACCFYANNSGVVQESLSLVWKNIADRQRERERSENWYQSLFRTSPWLTTLISALAGPLLLLAIALIFGPCLVNRLLDFVKSHINSVKLLLVRDPRYQPLASASFAPYNDAAPITSRV
ncbi:endogenous retrovirus group S71 member 1 Env polyprotein [Phascolarctos cinereus]|uniref:Endogenous retrovirus group S71 member 1 Env polyprotein n=1 Tax=Phascolarctos cinereus TaxID=38626 RepID=A0A6P5J983_PHACI|nr:endogenous retrovirus group S71 member 1 Env polyprotein [Phascolarctos cinereus]XP_020830679.1 endogenous retrovirus group S71 member 1 Env polyprotein [Phascolarctos cinereus]XP_020830680.1 endogenous retrovirus group S71 member 1 Env polyprotein [Phascolarctos cinereus]XP_020830681.1 endogenous retrovirus group S71 member 1 Env polyprotein [Phascolarctos cinereus]XP_020830682.1 endogenous retrovirus group S71 member 1 Env polyprotein [Phascolarctos cinereus]XP_020830683.1 endogenous retr